MWSTDRPQLVLSVRFPMRRDTSCLHRSRLTFYRNGGSSFWVGSITCAMGLILRSDRVVISECIDENNSLLLFSTPLAFNHYSH